MDKNNAKIFMGYLGNLILSNKKLFKKIKYIALKKNLIGIDYLEIGYNKNSISSKKLKKRVTKTQDKFNLLFPYQFAEYKPLFHNVKIIEQNTDFSFINGNQTPVKAGITIRRKGDSLKRGTLGAIIKLKKQKELFILSNYHVLFSKISKLGQDILESDTNRKIGESYWGLFNENYDIGIAKITCEKLCKIYSDTKNYNFGITSTISNISNEISMTGGISKYKTGKIYSLCAHVNIKGRWFTNQMILNNLKSNPGDSGTIIVDGIKGSTRNVVGLVFAKDNGNTSFTVANHLFNLFDSEIQPFLQHGKKMPKIQFDSFY